MKARDLIFGTNSTYIGIYRGQISMITPRFSPPREDRKKGMEIKGILNPEGKKVQREMRRHPGNDREKQRTEKKSLLHSVSAIFGGRFFLLFTFFSVNIIIVIIIQSFIVADTQMLPTVIGMISISSIYIVKRKMRLFMLPRLDGGSHEDKNPRWYSSKY